MERFLEEMEQIQAREITGPKKSNSQKWIIDKLIKISKLNEYEQRIEEIETLLKAFSFPITFGKLNRELRKVQYENLSNSEILDILEKLYQNFELQKRISEEESESTPPRILYSKYVGNKVDKSFQN